ncbi:MAG: site-specific integrase [Candidatus Bathyarchaeia archaeon]
MFKSAQNGLKRGFGAAGRTRTCDRRVNSLFYGEIFKKPADFGEDLENFRRFLFIDRELSERTARDYARAVKRFFKWVGRDIITRGDLRDQLQRLKEGYSVEYRKITLSALRAYFDGF